MAGVFSTAFSAGAWLGHLATPSWEDPGQVEAYLWHRLRPGRYDRDGLTLETSCGAYRYSYSSNTHRVRGALSAGAMANVRPKHVVTPQELETLSKLAAGGPIALAITGEETLRWLLAAEKGSKGLQRVAGAAGVLIIATGTGWLGYQLTYHPEPPCRKPTTQAVFSDSTLWRGRADAWLRAQQEGRRVIFDAKMSIYCETIEYTPSTLSISTGVFHHEWPLGPEFDPSRFLDVRTEAFFLERVCANRPGGYPRHLWMRDDRIEKMWLKGILLGQMSVAEAINVVHLSRKDDLRSGNQ
jgi:hypothetical protein